ncbi:MAG: hypothetical protein ACREGI_02520 [Candidatus Levyibacteriota bacterium]
MLKIFRVFLAVFVFILIAGLGVYLFIPKNTKPTPGNCKIFEEKYCRQATFQKLFGTNANYGTYHLPAGAIIFSPDDGGYTMLPAQSYIVDSITKQKYSLPTMQIDVYENIPSDPTAKIHIIYYVSFFPTASLLQSKSLIKGQLIGAVSDKLLDGVTNANIIVNTTTVIEHYDTNGIIIKWEDAKDSTLTELKK